MEINKVHILLDQFNNTINQWIVWLDDYPLDMLCEKPRPQSWSLGQVYVHIIADTKYFVEQMKTSSLTKFNGEKTMHKDAQWIFEHNGFPNILLEGPSTNVDIPQPNSKDALLQALTSIKDDVNLLYDKFDMSRSYGKTEHPGLWFFNTLEWLQFAEMHMRHHFRQKKRIDATLGR